MQKSHSLSHRLSLVGALVLFLFLGSAGWALNQVFEQWVTTAVKEQASGHIFALLASADEDDSGLPLFTDDLPDTRLLTPDSGIYALVIEKDNKPNWKSPSLLGQKFNPTFLSKVISEKAGKFAQYQDQAFFYLGYRIEWEAFDGEVYPYQLVVILDLKPYQQEATSFRSQLWVWLGGSGLFLLLIQFLSLRWALKPLHVVTKQINKIQSGHASQLSGDFPRELDAFKKSLNQLIAHNHRVTERYKNKLGDLAHSLKTPLAVLQNAYDSFSAKELKTVAAEQLPRISEILDYQLSKASVVGQGGVLEVIEIEPIIQKLIFALQKVYYDKNMQVRMDIEKNIYFQIDSGDLMELLGNLLDNAFKYGSSKIAVNVSLDQNVFDLQISDDGFGIEPEQIEQVLKRGVRLDERSAQGQGIGLNIVSEIVSAYDGTLSITQSPLGGSNIHVRL